VRYPITFTVDAVDFTHARQIARGFRNVLRSDLDDVNGKLLKLRDPAASAGPSPRPAPDFQPGDDLGDD
jgi:hypothetical protein